MQDQPFADPVLRRDAFNLVSALDAYDIASTRLVESWLDMEVYADLAQRVGAIREHGVSVPALTVLSLQLVIAHAELVSILWQNASVGVCTAKMDEIRERHAMAVNALRAAAVRLLRND